jgi:hypothetical protein
MKTVLILILLALAVALLLLLRAGVKAYQLRTELLAVQAEREHVIVRKRELESRERTPIEEEEYRRVQSRWSFVNRRTRQIGDQARKLFWG